MCLHFDYSAQQHLMAFSTFSPTSHRLKEIPHQKKPKSSGYRMRFSIPSSSWKKIQKKTQSSGSRIRFSIPSSSWKRIKFLFPSSSWNQIRKLLTSIPVEYDGYGKLTSSCTSISRDVIHGNTIRVHHLDDHNSSHYPSTTTSTRSSLPNHVNDSTITSVSELGPEDLGRDTIEMIFKSSWLEREGNRICNIQRILKVHNTQSTIQRFEECRDSAQRLSRCNTRKNPRCAADGNEQLRFHCTTSTCSLGTTSTNLCNSVPGACGVCSVLKHGFPAGNGVPTTASSLKAHDDFGCVDWDITRAMLVCRVIAGRAKHKGNTNAGVAEETYDAIGAGCCQWGNGSFEELFVFNPEAVLPCFVVIYTCQ